MRGMAGCCNTFRIAMSSLMIFANELLAAWAGIEGARVEWMVRMV